MDKWDAVTAIGLVIAAAGVWMLLGPAWFLILAGSALAAIGLFQGYWAG